MRRAIGILLALGLAAWAGPGWAQPAPEGQKAKALAVPDPEPPVPGVAELLAAPEPMVHWVREMAFRSNARTGKLQALLAATFAEPARGGLGIQYDNERTRTVAEVWAERKANCLSLTAFFVAACRVLGVESHYAEALNTNRWVKVDGVIRFERHVVALIPVPPLDDLVADFIPTLRRRSGVYLVAKLGDARFLALFHSNRAVERLQAGDLAGASAEARVSLSVDPKSGVGWNIQGVIHRAEGDLKEAEACYRKALQIEPSDCAALDNLEHLLRDSGRDAEAARFREMGETVRRKDPYFNAYLGEEALAAGDMEEAQRRIRIALRLLPRESEFHLLEARLRLAQGRLDEAIASLNQAKKWATPGERARFESKLDLIRGLGQGKATR